MRARAAADSVRLPVELRPVPSNPERAEIALSNRSRSDFNSATTLAIFMAGIVSDRL